MKQKLKVALVGCGGMAGLYRHVYTEMENAELYMLIDSNEEVAKAAAEQLKITKHSTKFEDCLCEEVDVVDISTPNFLHKEQAIAALRAGKKVFLQKPITVNVEEALEIAREEELSEGCVGVYMELRSHPVFNEVRDIVQKGLLGEITSTRARLAQPTGLYASADSWRSDKTKTGGGGFIQLGVHYIDGCMWILNDRIKTVAALSSNRNSPNLQGDDSTLALLEYESGVFGVIEGCYNSYGRKTEVYGTKGSIIVNGVDSVTVDMKNTYYGDIIQYDGKGEQTFKTGFSREALYSPQNKYEQHRAFIDAMYEGIDVPVPLSEGIYDMQIISAVYESAEQSKYISIKKGGK